MNTAGNPFTVPTAGAVTQGVSVKADGDLSAIDSTVPLSIVMVEESDGSNHKTRPGKLAGDQAPPNLYESISIDISIAPRPDQSDFRPRRASTSARNIYRDLPVIWERQC